MLFVVSRTRAIKTTIISLGQTFQASTSLTEGMKIKFILDEEVETTFKALTTCLQFVGLYVPPGRRHCQVVAQWIYSVTFLALGWFNAARFCIIFGSREGFSGSLMVILSYFICFLGSAYMSTALLYACTKHMDLFLKDLSDYKKLFGVAFNLKKLKIWIVIFLSSIAVYEVFAFTAYVIVFTVFTQSNFNDINVPFDKMKGISRIFGLIFISATIALSSVPSFIVLVFVSSCCYILGKEYDAINSAVIQMGNDKDADVKCETIRHQHTVLTGILDKANHMITHFLFTCCAVCIPVICFLLYGLVRGGLTTEEFLAALVTATSGISTLLLAFITSANLSVKV